jgi:hypothetical protein
MTGSSDMTLSPAMQRLANVLPDKAVGPAPTEDEVTDAILDLVADLEREVSDARDGADRLVRNAAALASAQMRREVSRTLWMALVYAIVFLAVLILVDIVLPAL